MPRPFVHFALLSAVLSVGACTAPFVGVPASDEPSAGEGFDEGASGGPLLGGGRPGTVVKPTLGGTGGTGGTGEGGAPGAAGDAAASAGQPATGERGECPDLEGAKLALAGSFCIDESEVTVAHYRAFLERAPSVLDQPASCASNATFANNCKFTNAEKEPQRCVDWCDARAYCESVGKRLCGSTEGGAVPFEAGGDSAEDEWYAACSRGGALAYPYGAEYDGEACWGADKPGTSALTVKSASSCVGGYEGVWDLSGGLAEWVDSCSAESGPTDACRIRGGSSSGTAEQLRCDAVTATARSTTSSYIGFRCCADLVP